jgi:hypothetical protein
LELGFEVWEVIDFAVEDEGILFIGAVEKADDYAASKSRILRRAKAQRWRS